MHVGVSTLCGRQESKVHPSAESGTPENPNGPRVTIKTLPIGRVSLGTRCGVEASLSK